MFNKYKEMKSRVMELLSIHRKEIAKTLMDEFNIPEIEAEALIVLGLCDN